MQFSPRSVFLTFRSKYPHSVHKTAQSVFLKVRDQVLHPRSQRRLSEIWII